SLFSRPMALWYFNMALKLCRLTGTQPSLLLHPTDFLGCDDTQELSFFPAMGLTSEKKLELVSNFFQLLCARFTVVTLQQHALQVAQMSNLPILKPNLS
ncbi:MAG: polysaccharide deacetylase family protein, partial [bacterium]